LSYFSSLSLEILFIDYRFLKVKY